MRHTRKYHHDEHSMTVSSIVFVLERGVDSFYIAVGHNDNAIIVHYINWRLPLSNILLNPRLRITNNVK